MIKGVNKKIIEINNPDSLYFDKVILYIKPNKEIQSSNELSYEVDRYLKSIIKNKKVSTNSSKHLNINSNLGVIMGMAIVLTMVILLILI